jgi:hypothetical protein
MECFPVSILNNLPVLEFFEGDTVILRKGGSLFGKVGPTKLDLRPKKFAYLEFYRFGSKDKLLKASDILEYLPFPVVPNKKGDGSWLYLHRSFGKRENYTDGYKKIVQLSSCTFVGLFLEEGEPIACSHQFYICSKKNLRTGPNALEKRATKRRKKSDKKELSEEDEEEGAAYSNGHSSAEDSNFNNDNKMGSEQMMMHARQCNTIFAMPIVHNVANQKEDSSFFSSELQDGPSIMKVSHLVDPPLRVIPQQNQPIITHQMALPFNLSQFPPDLVNQSRLESIPRTRNQNQVNEPLNEQNIQKSRKIYST